MNRWTSGILVDNDVESITQENYDMILKKAENVANSWTNRGLTLIRKVLVINSLIGSLFVYRMNVLLNMSDQMIRRFYEMVNKYFWGEGQPKPSL